jgi:hypothetical protein
MDAIEAMVDSTAKTAALAGYFSGIAQTDPEVAIRELVALSDPQVSRDSLPSVFKSWIQQDRETALAFVGNMEAGHQKALFAQQLGSVLARDPTANLVAWAAAHTEGANQASLVSSMVARLAQTRPHEAVRSLDHIPLGNSYTRAIEKLGIFGAGQIPNPPFAGRALWTTRWTVNGPCSPP